MWDDITGPDHLLTSGFGKCSGKQDQHGNIFTEKNQSQKTIGKSLRIHHCCIFFILLLNTEKGRIIATQDVLVLIYLFRIFLCYFFSVLFALACNSCSPLLNLENSLGHWIVLERLSMIGMSIFPLLRLQLGGGGLFLPL